MTPRDFDKDPYTGEELRVVEYLIEIADIGGGDDPIGFLIASHASLRHRLKSLDIAAKDDK